MLVDQYILSLIYAFYCDNVCEIYYCALSLKFEAHLNIL